MSTLNLKYTIWLLFCLFTGTNIQNCLFRLIIQGGLSMSRSDKAGLDRSLVAKQGNCRFNFTFQSHKADSFLFMVHRHSNLCWM